MLVISSSIETPWAPWRADVIAWSRLDWLAAELAAEAVPAARTLTRGVTAPPRVSVPPDARVAVRRSARAWAFTPLKVGNGGPAALERASLDGSVMTTARVEAAAPGVKVSSGPPAWACGGDPAGGWG